MSRTKARKWLILATAGYALILLALMVVALSIFAKEQFQWLVGPAFLGTVVVMVLAGSIAVLIAAAALPYPRTWRTFVVIAWGLIAMTSPLFGWLFLLPWGVLLLSAPLIFSILRYWFRLAPG